MTAVWARIKCAILGHSFPPTSTKRDSRYDECRRPGCTVKRWR